MLVILPELKLFEVPDFAILQSEITIDQNDRRTLKVYRDLQHLHQLLIYPCNNKVYINTHTVTASLKLYSLLQHLKLTKWCTNYF